MKKRLFAAIAVPETAHDLLSATVIKLKKSVKSEPMRWLAPELWHITTWFFGDTQVEKIPEIEERLAQVAERTPPFELELKGLGGFPELMAARVLWAGVSRTRELLEMREGLYHRFSPMLEGTSVESDIDLHREYVPHMTLGRMKNSQSIAKLIAPFERKRFASFDVKEIVLFETQFQNYVSVYKPLSRFALRSE